MAAARRAYTQPPSAVPTWQSGWIVCHALTWETVPAMGDRRVPVSLPRRAAGDRIPDGRSLVIHEALAVESKPQLASVHAAVKRGDSRTLALENNNIRQTRERVIHRADLGELS